MIPQQFLNCGTDILGTIYIYVVNPLRAPETCASTIDVMVEVRGGPDLTYAVPKGFGAVPFVPQADSKKVVETPRPRSMEMCRYIFEIRDGLLLCSGSDANAEVVQSILTHPDNHLVHGLADSLALSGVKIEKDELYTLDDDLYLYCCSGLDETIRDFYIDCYETKCVPQVPSHPFKSVAGKFAPQAITVENEGLVECKTMGAVTHDQLTAHHAQLSTGVLS